MREDHGSNDPLKRAFREAQRRQDFADLQNEQQGLETGRMARFLSADVRERRKPGSERRSGERDLSRLQQLLATNAAYAAAYESTWDALDEAEGKAKAALATLTRKVPADNERLQLIRDTAARLPDGTRVFRDADGSVRTEHGRLLAPEAAESIVWTGREPGYEEFRAAKDALAETEARIAEIERYQVDVLGHARDRLSDEDNPPDITELENIQQQIETQMPKQVMRIDAGQAVEITTTDLGASVEVTVPKL